MTTKEFNEKWKAYLTDRHYGLDINDQKVIDYLDRIFLNLVKIPGFKYKQIKLKFGRACFYFDSDLTLKTQIALSNQIEDAINKMIADSNENVV